MDSSKSPYKRTNSRDLVLEKLRSYCAYQERCHQEVRSKILHYQIYGDDLEVILSTLIQEDYLNEERFACSYVRGKFNMKKWGKIKIRQGLCQRKISDYCIRIGFKEIDENDYLETLQTLLQKKMKLLGSLDSFNMYRKLYAFASQKGYAGDDINPILRKLVD